MKDPIVSVKQGQLKGKFLTNFDGENFFAFLGVSYAKAPIGNLRFKAPQPPEKWEGTKDATKSGNECYQLNYLLGKVIGSEDCLYLNVYTCSLSPTTLKPVMMFIHGGAFTSGSGTFESYSPEFLMTEDIVLVTINYRLGLLGFLSLDDESLGVPGNAGLKDQVMALKWIQENINAFGGDASNVTVFGQSAGGASVHLLCLSPMAKGLFHKGIAQSGCALNTWVLLSPHADDLASWTGVKSSDQKALLEKLQSMEMHELFKLQEKLDDCIYYGTDRKKIGVCIEKSSIEETFLSKNPRDLILEGKHLHVPLMIGYTSKEGIMDLMVEKANLQKHRERFPKNFEYFVPHTLELELGSADSKNVAAKIKNFYFNNEELSEENTSEIYDLKTDIFFAKGVQTSAKYFAKHSTENVYFYRMSVVTSLNFFKNFFYPHGKGVCHADDINYLFVKKWTPKIEQGSIEEISMRRFVNLWTSFAKYGNPTNELNNLIKVKWLPVEKNEMNYLEIGKELTVGVNPDKERMEFWDNIATTYNKLF